jgi:hypothetical protein
MIHKLSANELRLTCDPKIMSNKSGSKNASNGKIIGQERAGKFHIWSVGTIEEGIEVLIGVPTGRKPDSSFAPEGVFAKVDGRLVKMAGELAKFIVGRPSGK